MDWKASKDKKWKNIRAVVYVLNNNIIVVTNLRHLKENWVPALEVMQHGPHNAADIATLIFHPKHLQIFWGQTSGMLRWSMDTKEMEYKTTVL